MQRKLAGLMLAGALAVAGAPQITTILRNAQDKQRATSCLSNARQIAVAAAMYYQDYDEVAPRKGPSYAILLSPLLKNRQVFTCPLDPKGTISYNFNSNLRGTRYFDVESFAQTVMIYEGTAGKLNYRHQGNAAVGFVDGHCKWVGPTQAPSLTWTLLISKPTAPTGKKKAQR